VPHPNGDRERQIYDRWAGIYDRVFGRVFQEGRERVVRSLEVEPGARILEVGVGTGLCLPLYPSHARVTGVDLSLGMLGEAVRRREAEGLDRVTLLASDATRMPFRSSSFDLVVAAYVVTAVADHRALLGEMIRVTRPGGRLLLINHFRQEFFPVGTVERLISPLCRHLGFRTDLSVDDVVSPWPLRVTRNDRVRPLGMWHAVECVNEKPGVNGKPRATEPATAPAPATAPGTAPASRGPAAPPAERPRAPSRTPS
jgi:phosphatidylethanolamine/phosphatidyl-N-methylethanolamine N-methyltransferase